MIHEQWKYFAKDIGNCPIEELYRNPSFLQTMFCTSFKDVELDYILKHFEKEYIDSITEEKIPNLTNHNMIHQLYHLTYIIAQEYSITKPFNPLDVFRNIVEFGSGYGALASLIKRVTFNQTYSIIDLPELQNLQKKNLELFDINDVRWYNNIEELPKQKGSTLIALWSLSETPQETRDIFIEKAEFDNYFFAYGDEFFDMRNKEYFSEFSKRRPELIWRKINIPFMQNQYYLIGLQKGDKNGK